MQAGRKGPGRYLVVRVLRGKSLRRRAQSTSLVLCVILTLLVQVNVRIVQPTTSTRDSSRLIPKRITHAPIYQGEPSSEDPYWFQVGVKADNSTRHFTGVNITIRTAYDKIVRAGHSYWVGSYLANGAFIQVGYLNTVSEDNKPYCCAWFYEYFPSYGGSEPAVIGPPGSAGPIGTWHTYSMLAQGNGFWGFYMDNQLLDHPLFVNADDSGEHVAYPTAEVAGADNNQETLGPTEFKNFQVRLVGGWRSVPSARSIIYYAATPRPSRFIPDNPYGVWEVEGVDNDFLAGSYIPQAGPVQPSPGPSLWPVPVRPYHKINLTFVDRDQQPFTPTWVALRDNGTWSLYTNYENQFIMPAPSGKWTLDWVAWHNVNVAPEGLQLSVPGSTSARIQGNVFSANIQVLGSLYSLPAGGATVEAVFPDSLTSKQKADSSGQATFRQVTLGDYALQIMVPLGIQTFLSATIAGPGTITVRVLGIGELVMILALPVAALAFVLRVPEQHARRRSRFSIVPSKLSCLSGQRPCGCMPRACGESLVLIP